MRLITDPPKSARRVLTPSQLNAEAQLMLEEHFGAISLEGELSNFSRPASGHWYFTLKDKQAQVRCAMFQSRNTRVRFTPEAGMHLLLRGRVSLYVGRGEFQLIVDTMEPAGEGALRLAFEQLRRRLADEGLFEDSRKRPLPKLPRRIALITSPTGAAVRDLLSVLKRRWPVAEVVLVPTAVQGDAATGEILAAFRQITHACTQGAELAPDLVIVGRGGGSLEDLWCFNEEAVARAVASCPVPVVSAIGHETDYTITDFVADLRAPTPSAAAELVTPDSTIWQARLRNTAQTLQRAQQRRLVHATRDLSRCQNRLRTPAVLIAEHTQRIDELTLRLTRRTQDGIARWQERLVALQQRLTIASPRGQLARDARLLAHLQHRLAQADPRTAIKRLRASLTDSEQRLQRGEEARRGRASAELQQFTSALQALSPLGVIDRGYALLMQPAPTGKRFGNLVTSTAEVRPGDRLQAQVREGRILLSVLEVLPLPKPGGSTPG